MRRVPSEKNSNLRFVAPFLSPMSCCLSLLVLTSVAFASMEMFSSNFARQESASWSCVTPAGEIVKSKIGIIHGTHGENVLTPRTEALHIPCNS